MLTKSKMMMFILLGAIFWFVGATFIRLAGTTLFSPNNPLLVVLYVVSIPVALSANWIASIISRVPMRDMLEPFGIMLSVAIMLDGVAIVWVMQLYGENYSQVMLGAAWILFFGALGFVWAWVFAKWPRSSTS